MPHCVLEVGRCHLLTSLDVVYVERVWPCCRTAVMQVVIDSWHRDQGLSGIMVYFENCLVDSYSRGSGAGLPLAVPPEEEGYLAIVTFRGPADKQMFHPNPTKVCPRQRDTLLLLLLLQRLLPCTFNPVFDRNASCLNRWRTAFKWGRRTCVE